MSKVEGAPRIDQRLAPSAEYLAWLRAERREQLTVRGAQLALLLLFLVLWEVLPRAQVINPLFTSYPSALWPTFVELLKATPQQASILTHTWSTVLATGIGFTAAMALGTAIAAALCWWQGLYRVL
jgi:NitT/TauT family transport system permease protein